MRGVFSGLCCVVGAGFRGWWYLCSRGFCFLFVCCVSFWVSDLQVVVFLYLSGVFMSLRKLGNVSARRLYWLGL